MKESVFTTFKVWDNVKGNRLSKKKVLDVAFEHFMDIKETFDLDNNAHVRQTDLLVDNDVNVYVFEIRNKNNELITH